MQRLQVATCERDDTKRLNIRVFHSSIIKSTFLQIGVKDSSQICIKSYAAAEFSLAFSGGQNKNDTGIGGIGSSRDFRLEFIVEFIYECSGGSLLHPFEVLD